MADTKTEQLFVSIRKMPIARQLIPMEAAAGWPIPSRKDGRVYITVPFFGVSRTPVQNRTRLFPPFAKITLDWQTQLPVEYINLRYQNLWPNQNGEQEVGTFPHPSIADWTTGEYRQHRQELMQMYDQLFETLVNGTSLAQEWNQRFSTLLSQLMEPSLEPFYRILGPAFFSRFLSSNEASASSPSLSPPN